MKKVVLTCIGTGLGLDPARMNEQSLAPLSDLIREMKYSSGESKFMLLSLGSNPETLHIVLGYPDSHREIVEGFTTLIAPTDSIHCYGGGRSYFPPSRYCQSNDVCVLCGESENYGPFQRGLLEPLLPDLVMLIRAVTDPEKVSDSPHFITDVIIR